jgi:anti-sigma regulatory factor (Ser/Thr protein kinase)
MGEISHHLRSAFSAKIEDLESMMDWIRTRSVEAGFSGADLKKIELATEEALVNIINHASVSENDPIEILCRIPREGIIHFTIKDKGKPFNPLLQYQQIDLTAPLEDRREGGVGILLILQYMDDVHYERQHPYNLLTLTKRKS